jgi:putative hydrolase of the HAD superfamily
MVLRLVKYNCLIMSDEPNVRAVLFDYGMVLSGPPDPTARVDMERILGIDEGTFQAAYWKHRDAYDRGTLSGLMYWESVARDCHKPLNAVELDALIDADNALWTQPNQLMIDWAVGLQRAGMKTGLLSNIGDAMEAGIRERFPWLNDFAHATFSHRLGIAKPDPAIYLYAAEGLNVPVGEILIVDDKEENILAAQAAGMVAVQYTNHEAFVVEMKRLGLDRLLYLAKV